MPRRDAEEREAEREEEKEVEREEQEVVPEQRLETKHGQEEKQEEVLQALGQRFSRSPCWRQRARRYPPRDAAACSEHTQVQGRSVRRKEWQSRAVEGLTATAPDPGTSRAAGRSRTHA